MRFRFDLTRAEMLRIISAPVVGRVGHRVTQERVHWKAVETIRRAGHAFVESKMRELEGPIDGWKPPIRAEAGRRKPLVFQGSASSI